MKAIIELFVPRSGMLEDLKVVKENLKTIKCKIVYMKYWFSRLKEVKYLLLLITLISISSGLDAQEKTDIKYGESQTQWNKILKQDWFEQNPNKLVAETIKDLKPGKALDVGTGEGRNAIFLAQKGWNVTGFDIADEALDSIQQRAKRLNLNIKTVHASGEDFNYGKNKWDLVVLCYIDIICEGCVAYGDFISKLARSVKKGGIVVYESYHRDHFVEYWEDPGSWGCTEDQLTKEFEKQNFKVVSCVTTVEKTDWSDGNRKVIKFVAQKL